MAAISKLISNDPLTGLARMVKARITLDTDVEYSVRCLVDYLDEAGKVIDINRVKSYEVLLSANNTTKVDFNGNYVDPDTEGAIGEYDFLSAAINTLPLPKILLPIIDRADKMHRFDV